MGSFLVVVLTSNLIPSVCVVKTHEPIRIQALAAELAVESFGEGVVCWFAWPRRRDL